MDGCIDKAVLRACEDRLACVSLTKKIPLGYRISRWIFLRLRVGALLRTYLYGMMSECGQHLVVSQVLFLNSNIVRDA